MEHNIQGKNMPATNQQILVTIKESSNVINYYSFGYSLQKQFFGHRNHKKVFILPLFKYLLR